MKALKTLAAALALTLLPAAGLAEADAPEDSAVYTMVSLDGAPVMSLAGRIYPGDEYIASNNLLYAVLEVDDEARRAVAQCLGE